MESDELNAEIEPGAPKNDIEMIETLFLIGQYQTAYDLSVKELDSFVSASASNNYYIEPIFTSLVVVSLQSLSRLDGKIIAFLKKYYNSLDNVSYEVLFLRYALISFWRRRIHLLV
jgi:hypothetical protein